MIRKPQSSAQVFIFLTLSLFILMAAWEANRSTAAFAAGDIPQDAIRLRILANSDTVSDQWIKHKVRDAVVEQMDQWVSGPQTVEEARETIRSHLPELEALVSGVLQQYGYTYGAQTELGVVPFPTKMYGDRVYPAGNYEALRISLGKAEGQNWWCVLFPPLCFVDAVTNEAVAADDGKAGEKAAGKAADKAADKTAGKKADRAEVKAEDNSADHTEDKAANLADVKAADGDKDTGKSADASPAVKTTKTSGKSASSSAAASASGKPVALAKAGDVKAVQITTAVTAGQQVEEGKTEYKFFLWELLKKLFSLFK